MQKKNFLSTGFLFAVAIGEECPVLQEQFSHRPSHRQAFFLFMIKTRLPCGASLKPFSPLEIDSVCGKSSGFQPAFKNPAAKGAKFSQVMCFNKNPSLTSVIIVEKIGQLTGRASVKVSLWMHMKISIASSVLNFKSIVHPLHLHLGLFSSPGILMDPSWKQYLHEKKCHGSDTCDIDDPVRCHGSINA